MPKIKLTDAAVEKLKAPAEGQVDYFDAAYPALALRVSAKVRSWVFFGRVHGKLRRVTLGRYPTMTLKAARIRAGEVADQMSAGVDPTAEKRAARTAIRDSFEAVADEWLKRDQAGNRSADEVRRVIERDVKTQWHGRMITDIRRRDVLELIDGIADRGAVTLARRVHSHLHRLFRWSVGRGIIDANPMADLPKPGSAVKRDRVLSDAELALVWRSAEQAGWPFRDLFRLLILTGARREEIAALRWSEIDGDVIRLTGARTKNGEPHDIPLSPQARAILDAVPRVAGSAFVFTTTGTSPVSGWSRAKANLDKRMVELGEGAPIEPWRLHDFRRTLATGLQRLGVGLEVIETALGHVGGSRAGIVGIYQRHRFADETRRALDLWADFVAELFSKKPAA